MTEFPESGGSHCLKSKTLNARRHDKDFGVF